MLYFKSPIVPGTPGMIEMSRPQDGLTQSAPQSK